VKVKESAVGFSKALQIVLKIPARTCRREPSAADAELLLAALTSNLLSRWGTGDREGTSVVAC